MDVLKELEVQGYFKLDDRIEEAESVASELRYRFYDQSFLPHTVVEAGEIRRISFNLEQNVVSFVDVSQFLAEAIDRLKLKKNRFAEYLKSIPKNQSRYLIKKYRDGQFSGSRNDIEEPAHAKVMDIEAEVNDEYGFSNELSRSMPNERETMKAKIAEVTDLLGV